MRRAKSFVTKVYHRMKRLRQSIPIMTDPLASARFFTLCHGTSVCRFHLGSVIFFARHCDWLAVDEIVLHGEYDFVLPLLTDHHPPVVVDLGANIGVFSALILNAYPSAVVHAVEPEPNTYALLEHSRSINSGLRWMTYNAAMWSHDGEISFVSHDRYSTGSFVSNTDGTSAVPAMRLSTLLQTHVRAPVNILKVDIEGAEEAVLCDNPDLLQHVDMVLVEIHPYRCDEQRVVQTLHAAFPYLYQIEGRRSQKPLLLATRQKYDLRPYGGD